MIDPSWTRIAPGVYDDGNGGMHLEVTELLEANGFEDTPENRRTLETELERHHRRGAGVSEPPVSERYVDARELAELMGVSVSTVKRMVAAGMPSETWGMSRTRRYLPSQAIAWAHTSNPDRTA